MSAPIRIKDSNSSARLYSFNLSFGGMALLVTTGTLALTLFFILGVLVGRGHRPEAAVPVVANMMPKEPMARPAAAPEVLKAEELGYADQLVKRGDGAKAETKSQDKPQDKPQDKVDAKADTKADTKKDAKADAKADAKKADKLAAEKLADQKAADQKAAEKKADKKAAEKKPDPDTQRYDYAYQVATFPDGEAAKAYLKRVKAMGIKGDIETGTTNGKSWHRVVVFFQGTPTDTRGLKEKLSTLGAQKLVMRSKTPI